MRFREVLREIYGCLTGFIGEISEQALQKVSAKLGDSSSNFRVIFGQSSRFLRAGSGRSPSFFDVVLESFLIRYLKVSRTSLTFLRLVLKRSPGFLWGFMRIYQIFHGEVSKNSSDVSMGYLEVLREISGCLWGFLGEVSEKCSGSELSSEVSQSSSKGLRKLRTFYEKFPGNIRTVFDISTSSLWWGGPQ